MSKRNRLIGFLLTSALLAACGRSALVPARSSPVTISPTTSTPVPVLTPTPIVTPEPTATITPTTTPTPEPAATLLPPTETPVDVTIATADGTPESVSPPLPADPWIGQHPYSMTLQVGDTSGITQSVSISYLLYLPRAYGQDPAQTWPLILFLHGSGENGTDPEQVAANGLPQLLTGDVNFRFMVLSPQAPDGVVWWGTELDQVNALLDYIQANYAVDPGREYLTGISMGGFGAWAMAVRYPKRFAAVVPIAGGWNSENDSIPGNICALKSLPIWVFHGEQDDIVSPNKSQLMVDALKKCGSDVMFTLYPDADHRDSWAKAYADPALFEWLLAQHLP